MEQDKIYFQPKVFNDKTNKWEVPEELWWDMVFSTFEEAVEWATNHNYDVTDKDWFCVSEVTFEENDPDIIDVNGESIYNDDYEQKVLDYCNDEDNDAYSPIDNLVNLMHESFGDKLCAIIFMRLYNKLNQ